MSIKHKQIKRTYRRITPETVAAHKANALVAGNNTKAVRDNEFGYGRPDMRAVRIVAKGGDITSNQYIDDALQQMSEPAMERISNTLYSADETLATRTAIWVAEQIRGKSVQRSENKNLNISIESVL